MEYATCIKGKYMEEEIKLEDLGASIKEIERLLGESSLFESDDSEKKKVNQTVVRVTKDLHEGWLYLARPKEGERYSKEEVLSILEQNGVKAGYIMSNIIAMVKKGVYERSIKVAKYKECEQGKNGHYEYTFDTNAVNKKNPRIREDGSVDYNSVNFMISVSKGQKICTYYPAEEGVTGYLVDGTIIEPAKTAELPTIKGKGIRYDEETRSYYSEMDGKLDFRDTYDIQIKGVHQIQGDVNQLNYKVEFNGDIEITGNVETGAIIRSTRNVIISGVVEGAEIYAGGDVILKRGIQGSHRAKIICNGSVYADFIEHTTVKAKGDVNSNSILNSEVFADGKVILTGKRGSLIGGYTHGRQGISCVNLGNSVEVKTVAHVGLETKDYLKNQDVIKKDAYLREQLKMILDNMNHILAIKKVSPITKEELDELNELNARKNELSLQLKDNIREQEIISKVVEEAMDAQIRVEEHIYKGSIIAIDASRMPIKENTKYMIYKGNNGVIEGSVIIVN